MSYSRRMVGSKVGPPPARPSLMWFGLAFGSAIFVEDLAHRHPHVRPRQGEGDVGLQPTELVAAIEALAVETQSMDRLVAADQLGQPVGELDLIAGAAADTGQMIEDLGLQNVAPDDAEIGRRHLRVGLLDDALHRNQPALILRNV